MAESSFKRMAPALPVASKWQEIESPTTHDDARNDRERMDREIGRIRSMLRRTINPNGRFLRRWNIMLLIVLILTAIVTPIEIAFADGLDRFIFTVNRFVDAVLVVDIGVNFLTPYRESPKKGARWVYNPRLIGKHYVCGQFAFDLLTSFPTDAVLYDAAPGTSMFGWRAVRVVRVCRVVQLNTIVRSYVASTGMDLSVVELIKFLFLTLFTAHWLACLWAFVGKWRPSDPIDLDTWYVQDYTRLSWIQKHQFSSANAGELYTVRCHSTRHDALCSD